MKSKFKITDFSPPHPPKMKRKNRFTIKELLQLQKKKEKTKILQNMKKKRGFITAELSPQSIMRKKIKNNIIVTRISPPKQPKRTKTKFIIEDIPSPPKQPRSSTTSSMSSSISSSSPSTPCCYCNNLRSVQTNAKCAWCQLHYHLKKCVSQNAKERNKQK